jgi:predicted AlkP superfamily phosphohydrolase/phosphomutase
MRFLRKRKRRVCVVGLDGVPYGLLKSLADSSVMPHTASIIASSALRQMRASLPPVSSVSWSSFMTGENPAEHGVFGFTDVDSDTYKLRFPLFSDLAVPTFWDRLGHAGRRCAVINQPATYPARSVPGALVSGFVALRLERSVWPKEHLPPLQRMGYRIDVESEKGRDDPDGLLDDLEATLQTRGKAAAYFWDQEPWDYFQLVVTGTDRLHHFLWNAVAADDDPRHGRAMQYYRAVDALIADTWERFHQGQSGDREGEGFVLLSDHGFTAVRHDVRLNAWLHDNGFLQYGTDQPASVADISPHTRAFALDPGRIHLNLKGRFAQGCVDPAGAPALRAEIAQGLEELSFDGERVMARIFTREEAFRGARFSLAPDLVAIAHDGFDLKGTTKEPKVFGTTRFQGMHTWEDAFVWARLPIPERPEIADLAGPITEFLSS